MARITITDARDGIRLRLYVRQKKSSISTPIEALWKKQATIITPATAKSAIGTGEVPGAWKDAWRKTIREFVRDDIATAWVKGIGSGGDVVAKKVNLIQRREFDFDVTMAAIKAWVDSHGGALIVDLTAAQIGSIHALLQSQIALGVTSPYILAQRIRPMIGLTVREAKAVGKFISSLTEDGVSPVAINKQVSKYTKYLHKNRASRIARTEISNAYNFGQMNSIKQAVAGDQLPGTLEKAWMAGGQNPCEVCLDNEAAGVIQLEEAFPSGHMHPTAHPQCECAVGYTVRR